MEKPIKILHLTDLHLFADPRSYILELNTHETLIAVIECLKKEAREPDYLIVSGDISQDYSTKSYELTKEILKDLNCQTFPILGNHDEPNFFKKVFHKSDFISTNKVITTGNWRIILLNSHCPKKVYGFLDKNELDFLEKELSNDKFTPTMIFLHHQATPSRCLWLNNIGLTNADIFLNLINNYSNIKSVICGHIHQELDIIQNNIQFLATPSTCFQFATNSDSFKLDNLMPGYRWIELYPNGTYTTEVIRIEHNKRYLPNLEDSKGY